jgi:hypothetical protein
VEYRYGPTLSLTSALDGVGGQGHASAALPLGENRYPLYRRLGRPQGRSGQVRKNPDSTGIRYLDRSARSVVAIPTELSRPPANCKYGNTVLSALICTHSKNIYQHITSPPACALSLSVVNLQYKCNTVVSPFNIFCSTFR